MDKIERYRNSKSTAGGRPTTVRHCRVAGEAKVSKAQRPRYPALFLGSSSVIKTLAEIAALEPVGVNDLPERENVTDANLGFTVRRLIALGLVRRYGNPDHVGRYLLALDHRHRVATPAAGLLRSIATSNRLRWTPRPSPSEDFAAKAPT